MIIFVTIAAISLALLVGMAIAATLGEHAQRLTFVPPRQPARIAVTVRPAGRSINPPLPPI